MRNIWIYAKNLAANIARSVRYRGKYKAPLISSFDNLSVTVIRGGKIEIGNYSQCRGSVYFVCDGGLMTIGKHCFFNIGCSVTCVKSILIGDGCTFGNNVVIVDHDHDFNNEKPGVLLLRRSKLAKMCG